MKKTIQNGTIWLIPKIVFEDTLETMRETIDELDEEMFFKKNEIGFLADKIGVLNEKNMMKEGKQPQLNCM